jgi:AraC-like DNA-binding protein
VAAPSDDVERFSAEFQICLPYLGLFVWQVGHDDVVADANQVLFVSEGEPYRLSQPRPAGYAELILTPDPEVLAEIAGVPPSRLPLHCLFRRRSRRAEFSLQRQRTRFLHAAIAGGLEDVAAEEAALALLRSALDSSPADDPSGPRTRCLIRRTKEYLEAHLACHLRLSDIARAVGGSPAYLTDVFRRAEGLPLHQYLMQLRLARALVELPGASDLTRLALDSGFSSHSHFAACFRRAFGCTPSQFRESTHRRPRQPAVRRPSPPIAAEPASRRRPAAYWSLR